MIYRSANTVAPPAAMALLCLSKRLHSIFLLRLFNDCFAALLVYLAILLFTRHRWPLGCFVYSLAVSVKMNALLFAPGLLLLLLQTYGVNSPERALRVVGCLAICAVTQLILAAPFLTAAPVSYLRGAFDLGRVFMFKWTVNWKFLPEPIFVGKGFALLLLGLTLLGWAALFLLKWPRAWPSSKRPWGSKEGLSPAYIVSTLFVSNLVGVALARTLHYQFYAWYFHQLPFLVWLAPGLPLAAKLGLLAAVEAGFNVYPATPGSSALLQAAHLCLLAALAAAPVPDPACQAGPSASQPLGPAPTQAKAGGPGRQGLEGGKPNGTQIKPKAH
eukprot:CAMPEP_0172595124 /NCGR_PEP_ID=MMETSP1068-20121228/14687_1 /TAXON_ID=35684 /ORGANISM="Pseudopedinella elastica, Strain CCMP716" /LENGTH=329 /DNA_ID=CAMNT_0013393523 /DNA_START=315 /DNA_END=1304 /DNA_ORIENTATION=+